MIIHKTKDDEIIPDGGRVRVSMMAMDSTQKQIAAIDERVRDNIAANQATLARMQRDADRAAGFADHFTAKHAAEIDHSAYGNFCRRLSNDWQNPAEVAA